MNGILINEQCNIIVNGGSADIGDISEQIVENVLLIQPGELKEIPLMGAAIRQDLYGNISPFWAADTKKMIKAAGVDVHSIHVSNDGTIDIR